MIVVSISQTGKSASSKDHWQTYERTTKDFMDIHEAQAWVSSEYFSCKKRVPVYQDRADAAPVQCGHCYSFKVREDGQTHYERHWVTFAHVTHEPVDMARKRG